MSANNKELEALDNLALEVPIGNKDITILKSALTELKAIKEAKPSEAMKYVNGKIADLEDDLQHYTMVEKDKCREFFIREDLKQFTNIKQALLKAQELEKENAELKQHIKRWHDLLLKTGINSKGTVVDEIENYWQIKVEAKNER